MPPRRDKRAMVENRNEDGESSDESRHSPSITELPETWCRPAKGTPSDDVGWCFGQAVGGNRHHIRCTLCQKLVKGGVTRFKEHIAGRRGQVTACPNISHELRIQMKAHLVETKAVKEDKRKRQEELEERLKSGGGNDYNDDDENEGREEDLHIAHAMRESIRGRRMQEDQMMGTPGACSSRKWSNISSPEVILRSRDPLLQRSQSSKQPKINKSWLAKKADKLGAAWSKFIIYNRLPFHVVSSPWSQPLIDVAAELGPGVKNPSPYQISEVYMEREHVEMKEWIKSFKGIWKERGVTIMCDGWTSITKKHIINFLIYCNRGTVFQHSIDASDVPSRTGNYYFRLMDAVVEEIGEENVVQVVTDNEAAIKLGGKLLMEKRKHLYWTGCGAHCIDLMFEDIGKKRNVQKTLEEARVITSFIYNHSWVLDYMKKFTAGRELLRPAITRFATNFISLESISRYKTQLRDMMNSDTWRNSKWGKMRAGPSYEAKKIINGSSFWRRAGDIVKVHEPLVKVLRLVDGDEKPTMGFIYEAMDRAKRAIKQECRYWLDYWKIIDNRWSFQLHHDLHAAGYFLNPQFLYSEDTSSDCYREVLKGVKKVIQRMEPDIDNQIRAINQIQMYKHQDETFGTPLAKRAIMQTNPAEWWINYGCCAPQLQPIAVKVLSQTTSSSNCERNWSTFHFIHTKSRNRLKYKKLQILVFLHYNMRLKLRHTMRKSKEEIEASFNPINLDSIFEEDDPLCPWFQEREEPLLDNREDNAWLHSVDTDDTDEDSNDNHGNQHQQQSLSSSPANTSPNDPDDGLDAPSDDDGAGGNETYVGNEEGDMEASSSGGYARHDNLGGDNMTNMELLSYYNRQHLPPGLPPRHGAEGSSSQGMVLGYHGAEGSSSRGMVSGYHSTEGSSSQGMVSGYSDTSSHDSNIFQPLNVYPPSHNFQQLPLYYPSLPTSHEYEDHSPHLHPHPSQPIHYTEEPRGEIDMASLNNLFEKGWGWENKADSSSDMGGEAMEEPARRSFWW